MSPRAYRSPSFKGRTPASSRSTAAARGASKKSGTLCEVHLRRALFARGLRYRLNVAGMPGAPDIVFVGPRVAVFCDGDFWHGRDLERRLRKLAAGTNAPYWVQKISSNVERDRRVRAELQSSGWTVLRFWERDILDGVEAIADSVVLAVRASLPR